MIMADEMKGPAQKEKLVPVLLLRSQAPKGAVRLSEGEILKLQKKRIDKASTSEKTAFRFGSHIAGGTTAITACLVNTHFRSKFLLFDYGLAFSYGPTVIIPTVISIFMNEYLSRKVLLQPDCRGCLEVRSGVFQVFVSLFYSSLMAPLSSILLSKKYHTYLIRNNFQPGIKHALRTTSYHRLCFLVLIVHNFGIGAALRYKQGKQLEDIMSKEPVGVTKELLENLKD